MIELKSNEIWADAKRRGAIKNLTEETVFDFTQEEFDKCRFKMTNQNLRLVECTVHIRKFSHGFRLHPPHLWNLIEGILYKKIDGKFVKWVPNFSTNIKRLEESKKEID